MTLEVQLSPAGQRTAPPVCRSGAAPPSGEEENNTFR